LHLQQDHYEQTQKQLHEALELLRTTKERNSEHQQLVNQQVKTLIGESEVDINVARLGYPRGLLAVPCRL
jgi:hypothetical protein